MKKKSLLLAISAMSIAAIGVGTVGTFAWFSVSASVDHLNPDTATITAISGHTGDDKFDITVVPGTITNGDKVYLTNDSGVTKILSGSSNVEITPTGGAGYATFGAMKLKVEYKGSSATTAASVLSMWKEALTTDLWVQATDTTEYIAGNGFNASMISADAANKGLKFWTAAAAPSAAGDWVLSTHKDATVTVTQSTAENVTFADVSSVWTAEISMPGILVGVQGLDSVVQDADDTYQVTLTPSTTDPTL